MLEVVVGACLLLGLLTRLTAVGLGAAPGGVHRRHRLGLGARDLDRLRLLRRRRLDPNAIDEYPWEIARDVGLLLLSLWLVVRPRTPYAVDNLLFPARRHDARGGPCPCRRLTPPARAQPRELGDHASRIASCAARGRDRDRGLGHVRQQHHPATRRPRRRRRRTSATTRWSWARPTAPVKVVVYEDFLCPFCRQLETSTRDFLHQDAAKGKVQVEYRPFQLLPERLLPARPRRLGHGAAARHARAGTEVPRPAVRRAALRAGRAQARRRGAAGARPEGRRAPTRRCSTRWDRRTLRSSHAVQRSADVTAGVRGTPTVLVDGKPLEGARSRTWPTGSRSSRPGSGCPRHNRPA